MGVYESLLELYRFWGEPILMVFAIALTFIGVLLVIFGQFIYRKIDDAIFYWKYRK